MFDSQNAEALCSRMMTTGFYLSIYKALEMRGWLVGFFFFSSNSLSLSLELLLKKKKKLAIPSIKSHISDQGS